MEGRGSRLAQSCLREMRERATKGESLSGWEREREHFFGERGVEVRE